MFTLKQGSHSKTSTDSTHREKWIKIWYFSLIHTWWRVNESDSERHSTVIVAVLPPQVFRDQTLLPKQIHIITKQPARAPRVCADAATQRLPPLLHPFLLWDPEGVTPLVVHISNHLFSTVICGFRNYQLIPFCARNTENNEVLKSARMLFAHSSLWQDKLNQLCNRSTCNSDF